jgi:predicted nucleotidyltransferase component of viral defense system
MSEHEPVVVDISEWVERARHDPPQYLERQATEILLAAIGMASPYGNRIFLKGGMLMGLVYGSRRQTADLDFSTSLEPISSLGDELRRSLDGSLPLAAARLGYPDMECRVQTLRPQPRPTNFRTASFPAFKMTVAYAVRHSPQARHLRNGQCPDVLEVDISFKEPIDSIQVIQLGKSDTNVYAYSLIDLVAEKLRALLQQQIRNRNRRQDVYDIALLVRGFPLCEDEKAHLLEVFRTKCRSRRIEPQIESLSDPNVRRRASSEWNSLELELEELPSFDECFEVVDAFYRNLPW